MAVSTNRNFKENRSRFFGFSFSLAFHFRPQVNANCPILIPVGLGLIRSVGWFEVL